jgi:hypothetical protein
MENKAKKIKQLFVQDLAKVQGGKAELKKDPKCPDFTSLMCGEEQHGCSGC